MEGENAPVDTRTVPQPDEPIHRELLGMDGGPSRSVHTPEPATGKSALILSVGLADHS